jgi:hypothetical protein
MVRCLKTGLACAGLTAVCGSEKDRAAPTREQTAFAIIVPTQQPLVVLALAVPINTGLAFGGIGGCLLRRAASVDADR